jgi:alpha-galactosidase
VKIATIGAASVVWGPTINTDFLLNPALDGTDLILMDINAEALLLVERYLKRLVRERGFHKTIRATTDLDAALRDADYVLTAISVGGDRLWRYDAIFPQIDGIFQPVGDTVGPGGLMRALRHAGPLLQIARRMRDIGHPDVVLLQLTNPMNSLCAILESVEGLPVYGICHGVDDTEWLFAKQLGVPRSAVKIEAAGNNHNIFVTEIRVGDRFYRQEDLAELTPRIFDGPFRAEVFRQYGALVGNFPRHPIEFLRGFLDVESEFGKKWGVCPVPREIDPLLGARQDRARERLEWALAQAEPILWREERTFGGLALRDDGRAETGHSREVIDDFIVALENDGDFLIHLNLANRGAIEGVAPESNVEIPVSFEKGALRRKPIRFRNEAITREVERVGREQYLIAQGYLRRDFDLLCEALSLDALVPNGDVAARLLREMLAFEVEYVPRFAT